MLNGFSILYSPAQQNTDNTLITILGKPNGHHDSWQDNLIRIIINQLFVGITNLFKLYIINSEAPLIDKLRFVGILSANQQGSLQSLTQLAPTTKLEQTAKSIGITPTELMQKLLNQNLMPDTDAEPFFHNAIERLQQEDSITPIFDFSAKTTASLIDRLHELSNESIDFTMQTRYHNFVFHKNAIITGNIEPAFLDRSYNNLLLIDTSHSDPDYLENWKYLDPDTITGFDIVASNVIDEKPQATQQVLSDFAREILVPKSINILKEGM